MKILKYIIAVLIFINTAISFSQNKNFTVSIPYTLSLYKGVDNLVEVGFVEKKMKYTIECIGCDTLIKLKNTENRYVVKLALDSTSKITIVIKNKKGKLIQSTEINTFSPPKPILKLNNYFGFENIDSIPSTFKIVHEKHIPLHINYFIFNWKISIKDRIFEGKGKYLTDEVIDYMNEVKNGLMLVEIDYSGPFYKGKHDIIKEAFILNL